MTDTVNLPEVLRDGLPYRIVRPFRVRFEESTANETMRTAVMLAWLADIAWQHSVLLGFGRDWYGERGLFWLVRAIQLEVLAPLRTYQTAYVSTQVVAYRRIGARRESFIYDDTGMPLAHAFIDWVMTNERGIPCRVPEDFHRFVVDNVATFEMAKVALPEAPPNAVERRFDVRRRDLDPLDHVNNSVYLDYFEEALAAAGQSEAIGAMPRGYVLDFANSAARGDDLVSSVWEAGDAWYYQLTRDDGSEVFRGRLER